MDRNEYIFGIRAVMEAIEAGKDIDKVLIKKDLQGELVGEMFTSKNVSSNRLGIVLACKPGSDVTISVRTPSGSYAPVIQVNSDNYSTSTPWIKNTVNGTLFSNHANGAGGIKVQNGLITDWNLENANGTIEISGNAWDTKIDVKNGLITGWRYE
jgi:DUF4097 and DUF4098 domain-containing protein YvlB